MLSNTIIKYKQADLPENWTKVIETQQYSDSDSITVKYNTPKYKGEICWEFNCHYGYLAKRFELNGKTLQANNGESIHKHLNIHEDYCIRIGYEGWDKYLTKPYFEMWLLEK